MRLKMVINMIERENKIHEDFDLKDLEFEELKIVSMDEEDLKIAVTTGVAIFFILLWVTLAVIGVGMWLL